MLYDVHRKYEETMYVINPDRLECPRKSNPGVVEFQIWDQGTGTGVSPSDY